MTTIAVDDLTAEVLEQMKSEANARKVPLHAYLMSLRASAQRPPSTTPPLTPEQFRALLDDLRSGELPRQSLPADFSRADIYADHD